MKLLVNYLEEENVHLIYIIVTHVASKLINPCALALKMIGFCHKHAYARTLSSQKEFAYIRMLPRYARQLLFINHRAISV